MLGRKELKAKKTMWMQMKRKEALRKVRFDLAFLLVHASTRSNLPRSYLYHCKALRATMPPPRRLLQSLRRQPRQDRTPSPAAPPIHTPPDPATAPTPTVQQTRQDLMAAALHYLTTNRADEIPVPMDIDPPFDPSALGLKEIGNLASWTVSSCKPGCGVEALRDEDTGLFWQYVHTSAGIIGPWLIKQQIRWTATSPPKHPLLAPRIHPLNPHLPRLRSRRILHSHPHHALCWHRLPRPNPFFLA
jgi:hypothetical protein